MNAAEIVRAMLAGNAQVAALAGQRIYLDEAPDRAALPLIVYGVRLQETSDGSALLYPAAIDVHCYAASDDDAAALANAADNAMNAPGGSSGATRLLSPSLEDWDSVRDAEMAIWGRMLRYAAFVVRG